MAELRILWHYLQENCPSVCLLLCIWWQQLFVFCPRAHGDTQHCRKALHRAVQCTSDYPEHVCEVLLTMERTEGGDPWLTDADLESVPFAICLKTVVCKDREFMGAAPHMALCDQTIQWWSPVLRLLFSDSPNTGGLLMLLQYRFSKFYMVGTIFSLPTRYQSSLPRVIMARNVSRRCQIFPGNQRYSTWEPLLSLSITHPYPQAC